jgi:hypothetical protein
MIASVRFVVSIWTHRRMVQMPDRVPREANEHFELLVGDILRQMGSAHVAVWLRT